jgi:hypothetical protein
MFLFSVLAFSRTPVFVVPGLAASPLNGTVTGSPYWYCPQSIDDQPIWVVEGLLVPPLHNCVFDWVRLVWDPATDAPGEVPYAHSHPGKIGDIDAVEYLDTLFAGLHLVPFYAPLVEALVAAGYTKNADLFGLPYDWRYGVLLGDEYWSAAMQFIEKTVDSLGEKVALISHSMGGFFCHHFLTNVTTPEWRAKYIDSSIFVAPSFGGSGIAFQSLWTKEFPAMPFLGQYPDLLGYLGGLHIHMPNAEIYRDTVVYIGQDGRQWKAQEITPLLMDHEKLPGDASKIYERYTQFFAKAPAALDVATAIVYNSGLPMPIGFDASSGEEVTIWGQGDLAVNRQGPEWACSKWKSPKTLDCWDLNSDNDWDLVDHVTMLMNQEVLDYIVNHVTNSSWQQRL